MFLPTTRIPLFDTGDIAQFAALALHDPEAWNGWKVPIWNEFLTIEEMLKQLGKAVSSVSSSSSPTSNKNKQQFRAEIAERKATNLFVNIQLFMRDMSDEAAALFGLPGHDLRPWQMRRFRQ